MTQSEFKAKARALANAVTKKMYPAQAVVDAKREQMKRIPACSCGRIISANKKQCKGCVNAAV